MQYYMIYVGFIELHLKTHLNWLTKGKSGCLGLNDNGTQS